MKFLDLFSGIGGFRLGMEMASHQCVGYVEIDKYARKSYEAIHDTEGEWTASDIRSVTDNDLGFLRERGIDVLCGGFPCQAFSVAGKRGGFDDTRGTLFFEIARIAKQIKPRILFLENVKGLLSHDKGNTFGTILYTLDELGYDCEWQVLNSKDFGVPQNRERVFIIGHSRANRRREVFPIIGEGNEYITIGKSTETTVARTFTAGGHSAGNHSGMTMIVQPVLTPDREEKRQNGRRMKEPGEPIKCLNTWKEDGTQTRMQDRIYDPDGVSVALTSFCDRLNTVDNYRIRKITPRECWRLQGYPDWAFDKAREVNSDSQLYKQAGNSVTVNVIYEIAKRLGGNDID